MLQRNKKVCLIAPSLRVGGLERVLSLLANYASENGYEVVLICLLKKEIGYMLNDKVKVFGPGFLYKGGILSKLRVFYNLLKIIRQEKPDACLSFSEVFNPLSILVGALTKTPVFISNRSSPIKLLPKVDRLLMKLTYPLAAGLILQTEIAKEIARERKYNERVKVIPNPLRDINDFYMKQGGRTVLSMGRLIKSKKFDHLIDLFLAANAGGDWNLLILGDGPERENLENKIECLGLRDKVKLVGEVDDVDFHLANASIFAFASESEGFPNALHEAIAFPLPVISYDCVAGPADMIKDGKNGYLIPINDSERYVTRLTELMSCSDLRATTTVNFLDYRKRYESRLICETYFDFMFGSNGASQLYPDA